MSVLQPLRTNLRTLVVKRCFSSSSYLGADQHYRLVVVGGGSGGCATAAKFARKLGKGKVAVIEPATKHYYQPMWTLVGGGLKTMEQSGKSMESVLPTAATWIREKVTGFQPKENYVTTESGDKISYDFLVVAAGLELRYDKIKGLLDAFDTPGVCSNYSPLYVEKTTKAIKEFKAGGDAVFTFPNSPIKCAGAPQKIMYIAEETFRLQGKPANVMFYTALPVLFGVKKYADALWKVVQERGIHINLRHNLVEVKPDSKEAVFENLETKEKVVQHYDLLHVTPPMNAVPVVRDCKELSNQDGYLEIDKFNLQHVRFPNIFGIGDCTSLPTSKTAAAVAGQLGVLRRNLGAALEGKPLEAAYDGYTSCPLVTGKNSCILAEFDFSAPPQPLETFPINQAKERSSMYWMKAHVMPPLYFHGMLRGYWEGPAVFRKAMRLGMSK
jgi:NADPH-dependent 2,4-dienoyl-CoA reductase/sulfur reductase-like enzyme